MLLKVCWYQKTSETFSILPPLSLCKLERIIKHCLGFWIGFLFLPSVISQTLSVLSQLSLGHAALSHQGLLSTLLMQQMIDTCPLCVHSNQHLIEILLWIVHTTLSQPRWSHESCRKQAAHSIVIFKFGWTSVAKYQLIFSLHWRQLGHEQIIESLGFVLVSLFFFSSK